MKAECARMQAEVLLLAGKIWLRSRKVPTWSSIDIRETRSSYVDSTEIQI